VIREHEAVNENIVNCSFRPLTIRQAPQTKIPRVHPLSLWSLPGPGTQDLFLNVRTVCPNLRK